MVCHLFSALIISARLRLFTCHNLFTLQKLAWVKRLQMASQIQLPLHRQALSLVIVPLVNKDGSTH